MAIAENERGATSPPPLVRQTIPPPSGSASRRELGRGRSGVVYLHERPDGKQLACKLFDSRGLTKLVQWVILGAPNPYMWNRDAVLCARYRRETLAVLVPVWMAGKVSVADAEDVIWNADLGTFELQTRFSPGRAARLHHPLREDGGNEAALLWKDILPQLRLCLRRAGFDGLLWQAGIGNPVALNNFLLETADIESTPDSPDSVAGSWAWIDLESGVPAVFPISPKILVGYSLSHLWRKGRIPFDDVDVAKLDEYLGANEAYLRDTLGNQGYTALTRNAALLGRHQQRWKSLGRLQSSIHYRRVRGHIDADQARFYEQHRLRWLARESGRGVRAAASAVKRRAATAWHRVVDFDIRRAMRSTWQFLVSQRFREEFVCAHLDDRISYWAARGQMSTRDGDTLRAQFGAPDSSVYVTDFGIHLALKPAVKLVQYWILPALFAVGLLSGPTVAVLIITGGAATRTAYTAGRMIQSAARNVELPWIALGVGLLPVVGNLAYPVQMLFSIGADDQKLARFMLDDGFASIGRHLPVWGGQDTWTEHVFNRLPARTVEYWASVRRSPVDAERTSDS